MKTKKKPGTARKADATDQKTEIVSSREYQKKALSSLLEGDFDAALDYASDAIRLDRNNAAIYRLRSAIHCVLGNYEAKGGCASTDWKKAIRLDPGLTSVGRPSASELQFNLRPTSELPNDIDHWHDEHECCDDKWVDHGNNHVERAVVRSGMEYTIWQDRPLTKEVQYDLIEEFMHTELRREYEGAAANLLTVLGVEDY